jgi:hypothetical protein
MSASAPPTRGILRPRPASQAQARRADEMSVRARRSRSLGNRGSVCFPGDSSTAGESCREAGHSAPPGGRPIGDTSRRPKGGSITGGSRAPVPSATRRTRAKGKRLDQALFNHIGNKGILTEPQRPAAGSVGWRALPDSPARPARHSRQHRPASRGHRWRRGSGSRARISRYDSAALHDARRGYRRHPTSVRGADAGNARKISRRFPPVRAQQVHIVTIEKECGRGESNSHNLTITRT